jgi:hypothetical protein
VPLVVDYLASSHSCKNPAMATNHGLCALSHSLGMQFISTTKHVASLHYECEKSSGQFIGLIVMSH